MAIARFPFRFLPPLAAVACGASNLSVPSDEPAAQVAMVQGDDQVGTPGSPLGQPLIVQVTDGEGNPLPGQPVSWIVAGGGGAIDPASANSNEEGFAFAEWILGPDPGVNLVLAKVAGDTVTFSATASNGGAGSGGAEAGRIGPIQGDGQTAETGARVAIAPAVRVTDSAGTPIAGVTVNFVVTRGGGAVVGPDQTTGSDGIARVGRWTLGADPGVNLLEARAGTLQGSPVVFTAEATAPLPQVDRLIWRFPPPGRAKVNQPFAVKVALVDADGEVVPLDGILIYLGLFPEGTGTPTNQLVNGSRFESTVGGLATFEIAITKEGEYSLRALTDDLPELGPHGPEPWLYSDVFKVVR